MRDAKFALRTCIVEDVFNLKLSKLFTLSCFQCLCRLQPFTKVSELVHGNSVLYSETVSLHFDFAQSPAKISNKLDLVNSFRIGPQKRSVLEHCLRAKLTFG